MTACATTAAALQCPPGQEAAIDERLYFGTQRPGGVVTDPEWEAFIDEVIAPAFPAGFRSEEHTSELQSLMRISYAVLCLQKKQQTYTIIIPAYTDYSTT